jgi:hypothetical protein
MQLVVLYSAWLQQQQGGRTIPMIYTSKQQHHDTRSKVDKHTLRFTKLLGL